MMKTGNLVLLSVTKWGVHAEPIDHLIAWRLGDVDACLDGPILLFADSMDSLPSGAALGHHSLPRVASSSCEARHSIQNLGIRV